MPLVQKCKMIHQRISHEYPVWLNESPAGTVYVKKGQMCFAYHHEYPYKLGNPPLSVALPFCPEPFEGRAVQAFFSGLLPEGDVHHRLARALRTSSSRLTHSATVQLKALRLLGGECAGAVRIMPEGDIIDDQPDIHWLNERSLQNVMASLYFSPLLAGWKGKRYCLTGAQDKLPVVFEQGTLGLPLHGMPGTHILKFPVHFMDDTVHNEAFCLALAAKVGFPAVHAEILQCGKLPCLLVRRFDRVQRGDGRIERLHQEDFCQALGVMPYCKYEQDKGPGLAACFRLLRSVSSNPDQDTAMLLDAVLFNLLIGNHDAHAKNFALLHADGQVRLAPLYDLLSTAVYSGFSDCMAMRIGGVYRFEALTIQAWQHFAEAADMPYELIMARLFEMADSLPDKAAEVARSFAQMGWHDPVIDRIQTLIKARCEKVRQHFKRFV